MQDTRGSRGYGPWPWNSTIFREFCESATPGQGPGGFPQKGARLTETGYPSRVPEPTPPTLPFATRFWFAWACFFRVLFDGMFASRVWNVKEPAALPPAPAPAPPEKKAPAEAEKKAPPEQASPTPALQLIAMLQREGRLVDFLEQDIAGFPDSEIGSVARVVHEGCRKALRDHLVLAPIRSEEEGAPVTLAAGYSPSEVKLSGNVQGAAPYKGVLRHRGWRATKVTLPTPVKGHDPSVIAPAEVEL